MENPSFYEVFETLWKNILDKLKGFVLTETFNDHAEDKENNPHGVTAAQVGLGNVDNTSDADKPISDATQAALDGKADEGHQHWSSAIIWTEILPVECGGTGCDSIADSTYTTPRYRASALVNYEPTLSYANAKNGVIYWVYE